MKVKMNGKKYYATKNDNFIYGLEPYLLLYKNTMMYVLGIPSIGLSYAYMYHERINSQTNSKGE